MKKTWIGLIAGLFAASALIGCAGKEEGDTTAVPPPTKSTDAVSKDAPSAAQMGGGEVKPATQPGKADDMPATPEVKPEGETKPKDETKPADDHAGHNHAPGEGH